MRLYYPVILSAFGIIISIVSIAIILQGVEVVVGIMGCLVGFIVFCIGAVFFERELNTRKRLDLIQTFEKDLVNFDSQDLDNESERKVAFLALYDLYQRLLSMVGVKYCYIPQNQLEEYPLTELWDQVRSVLLKVEKGSKQYNKTIQALRNMHLAFSKYDRAPSALALGQIREETPEFTKWVIEVGNKYHRRNKDVIGFFFSTDMP